MSSLPAKQVRRASVGGLPTASVTFLFGDIEGGTRLSQQHPDAMEAALARHNALLRHRERPRPRFRDNQQGERLGPRTKHPLNRLRAICLARPYGGHHGWAGLWLDVELHRE